VLNKVSLAILLSFCILVLLGSFSIVEALTSVIIPLPSSTNEIFIRDIANTNPQASSIVLDKASYLPNEDVTITVTDLDSDLDPTNIDMVMVILQTPSGFNKIVILQEQGNNIGIFSGTATLDNVLPGEILTASYTDNPPGVGRLFGTIGALSGSGSAEIKDSDFRSTPIIDSFVSTCPWDLFTHTVDVRFSDVTPDPDQMTVTISYANTDVIDFEDLEVIYRSSPFAAFISLSLNTAAHDDVAKAITSQLPPIVPTIVGPSNGNGQYALGINRFGCGGGGSGGLIPPNDKNAFAQIIVSPVGGELIPIETTWLILANAQSFSWMIPVILSGIGIGLFVVSRKSENS